MGFPHLLFEGDQLQLKKVGSLNELDYKTSVNALGMDAAEADSTNVYLRWSWLQFANLSDALLSTSTIRKSNCFGTCFKGAWSQTRVSISFVNLSGANLAGFSFGPSYRTSKSELNNSVLIGTVIGADTLFAYVDPENTDQQGKVLDPLTIDPETSNYIRYLIPDVKNTLFLGLQGLTENSVLREQELEALRDAGAFTSISALVNHYKETLIRDITSPPGTKSTDALDLEMMLWMIQDALVQHYDYSEYRDHYKNIICPHSVWLPEQTLTQEEIITFIREFNDAIEKTIQALDEKGFNGEEIIYGAFARRFYYDHAYEIAQIYSESVVQSMHQVFIQQSEHIHTLAQQVADPEERGLLLIEANRILNLADEAGRDDQLARNIQNFAVTYAFPLSRNHGTPYEKVVEAKIPLREPLHLGQLGAIANKYNVSPYGIIAVAYNEGVPGNILDSVGEETAKNLNTIYSATRDAISAVIKKELSVLVDNFQSVIHDNVAHKAMPYVTDQIIDAYHRDLEQAFLNKSVNRNY